ncbi:MAG: T9SS type A sorting domain-containing protein [Chitinophagaceae bacterium]|nr:T9SS type A sorting domain-containing protein [Chitinophagaceae bacterium]
MKRLLLATGYLLLISLHVHSQLLTWTPAFPKDNDNITITLDASKGNQGLFNYANPNNVYVHVGVTTNLSGNNGQQWLYVNGATGGSWGSATPALKATSLGSNLYQFTINNIRNFFNVPAGETIRKVGILFRDANADAAQVKKAANTDGSDMYIPIYDNSVNVRFTVPPFQPTFIPIPEPISKVVGDNISVTAISTGATEMRLYHNGTLIQSAVGANTISASPTLTVAGNNEIVAEAIVGAASKKDTLRFFVVPGITVAPLPAGVRDGINYSANTTEATLVLYAPGKTRVSVIGEFPGSNWIEQPQYLMNKTPDGNYWWLKLTGLTAGTEYAFQYLVDGALKIGEPYTEKVLDPNNDASIPGSHYPGLRAYPAGQSGTVSILQTAAPAYIWSTASFARPDKRNLVVYELLVRDFLAAPNFDVLRDTLNYLKKLGINAIELMPVNEFDGNDSWGYNPSYFLAVDKYYGSKNMFKRFIDSCHAKGIAVIMDIALNHASGSSPLAQLYWNASANQTAANNPWFNVTATHPFSVFHDFNHEAAPTQYHFKRVVEHWLQEYRVDGFRFDLSKGFTQRNSGNDVGLWSQYDASRVALWKKYYDTLQVKAPGSYAILEHFAENSEELELSNYGMMFWGNLNYNFSQAAMGAVSNSNFDWYLHTTRGWPNPYVVSYMESHDEERMMYRTTTEGNITNPQHNVRLLNVGLQRMELDAGFFLTAPGPKMIWQFGELGYDYSINWCTNGTINDACRLSRKPIRWDYLNVIERKRLYDVYSSLNKLRFHPWYKDVFIANNITVARSLAGSFKTMHLRSATDSSMLVVMGNFDVTVQSNSVTFPSAGTWYDYLNGNTITTTGTPQSFTLQPGEMHVYLNRNLTNAVTTPVINIVNPGSALQLSVYPNPAQSSSTAYIFNPEKGNVQVGLWNVEGQKVASIFEGTLVKGKHSFSMGASTSKLPAGVYLLKVQTKNKFTSAKVLVQ